MVIISAVIDFHRLDKEKLNQIKPMVNVGNQSFQQDGVLTFSMVGWLVGWLVGCFFLRHINLFRAI